MLAVLSDKPGWALACATNEARKDSTRGKSPMAFALGIAAFACRSTPPVTPPPPPIPLRHAHTHISQNAGWSFFRRACAPVHALCPCPADLQTRIRELHYHHQLARALTDARIPPARARTSIPIPRTNGHPLDNRPHPLRLQPGRLIPWPEGQRRQIHRFPDRGRRHWS